MLRNCNIPGSSLARDVCCMSHPLSPCFLSAVYCQTIKYMIKCQKEKDKKLQQISVRGHLMENNILLTEVMMIDWPECLLFMLFFFVSPFFWHFSKICFSICCPDLEFLSFVLCTFFSLFVFNPYILILIRYTDVLFSIIAIDTYTDGGVTDSWPVHLTLQQWLTPAEFWR